jgi:hypothetical protein
VAVINPLFLLGSLYPSPSKLKLSLTKEAEAFINFTGIF